MVSMHLFLSIQVFILQLKPRDIARPKIFQSPAAAAAAASVTAAYALAKSEKLDFPQSLILNSNGNGNNLSEQDVTVDIDSIKEEKRVLELSLAEARDENSRLREKVDEVNSTHGDLSKVSS